jgi:threonine dehydratase
MVSGPRRDRRVRRRAPAMALSLREGVTRTTERVDTIADGIAVRVPVEEALSDLSGVVDDGATVGAMRLLFWKIGLVAEPAGAAGIAAHLAHRERFAGALVATPLCGSNLIERRARRWLLEDTAGC